VNDDGSPFELVSSRLKGMKPSTENRWTACCPAHEDSRQSLGICLYDPPGIVRLKCFTGCAESEIVKAINLEIRDLYPRKRVTSPKPGVTIRSLAFNKLLDEEFLKNECGWKNDKTDRGHNRILMPYRDELGAVVYDRQRRELDGKYRFYQPKGISQITYGRWLLPKFREQGNVLILVEGETDAVTLWSHKYPALGVPGSTAIAAVSSNDLAGFEVFYIWRDGKTKSNDQSGDRFAVALAAKIRGLRPGAAIKTIESQDAKDPNELHQKFFDEFKKKFDGILAGAAEPPSELPPDTTATPTAGGFSLTDLGNAQRLVSKHGADIRYSESLGRWYVWDGHRWQPRKAGPIIARAKSVVRTIMAELPKDADKDLRMKYFRHALDSESARAIMAMVKLTESDPQIVIETSQLDADPFLLNVRNGTVNLKTGALEKHRREDLLTKLCPVEFDAAAKCPVWESFLARVFAKDAANPDDPGDTATIAFVQRLMGYSLTGSISEQILPIFWGGGANGKSTLLNVIREILGKGYAAKAPRGLLMQKHNEQHPAELTVLFGARFVIATESKRGGRLSEDLVKDLTGDEAIQARYMKQDFFEFEPTHKLFLCTNHRPRITESDDGIWRRVILVPFLTKFWNPAAGELGPDHLRRDNGLKEKLRAQLTGILAWWFVDALSGRKSAWTRRRAFRK